MRHALEDAIEEKQKYKEIFGYQVGDKGLGSRLIVSNGHMMISEKIVAEGLMNEDYATVLAKFDNLPTRQHVKISAKGAAAKGGLFDNEVVYKGTRFMFEIELKGTSEDKEIWNKILETISDPLFRIGSGTRNGYGNLEILGDLSYNKDLDLSIAADFDAYLNHPASLNTTISGENLALKHDSSLTHYILDLTPDDFFIFSEGHGDDETDNKPVQEEIVVYNSDGFTFKSFTLIPGSSIKGAIAHRTAFHYNKLKERYAEELIPKLTYQIASDLYCGSGNKAVNQLFGLGSGFEFEIETKNKIKNGYNDYDLTGDSRRGHIIIDDIYLNDNEVDNSKIFNHVAIDRFTGGAMDTALFSEKVSHLKEGKEKIQIDLYLDKDNIDKLSIKAFENALIDITKGLLPLGGMTTKGHGMFTGTLTKVTPINKVEESVNQYHLKY